ncbi:3'-5' exonuclease [Candidatus Xenohaliotis californiensis]|uniref:3'-5' exonuclease n=1 Tax=Candidatus Xenohaliotis californiensis TaxID=84677 RepID=A0ABM9N7S3_9RICK|nr:3'-5' exonuclease [Candidatus Xenohaliotis californiensis]
MLNTRKQIMVFDIETIPDTNLAKNLVGYNGNNINEAREQMTNYHLNITEGKNPFLRQPFHKIVAISYVKILVQKSTNDLYLELEDIKSALTTNATEKELVSWFFQLIDKHQPGLISFNGRTFDIPVLKYRAMVHGIVGKTFNNSGDKWNNYNQRYNTTYHYDLIESLSDFGASARIKLNEICAAFGYPGKFGIDGANVASLYDSGKVAEIRNYCETDALNTYLVYLRYALHSAAITLNVYKDAIKQIINFIAYSNKEHLNKFHQAWLGAADSSIDAEIIATKVDNTVH